MALCATTAQAGLLDRLFGKPKETETPKEVEVIGEQGSPAKSPQSMNTSADGYKEFTFDQIDSLSHADKHFQLLKPTHLNPESERTWAYDALLSVSDNIDFNILLEKAPDKSVVSNAEQIESLLNARKFTVDAQQYDFNFDLKPDLALWLQSPFPEFKFVNTRGVNAKPLFLLQNLGQDNYKLVLQAHTETLDFYHSEPSLRYNPLLDNSTTHEPYKVSTYTPVDFTEYAPMEAVANLRKSRKGDENIDVELANFYYYKISRKAEAASVLENYYNNLYELFEDNKWKKLSDPSDVPQEKILQEMFDYMVANFNTTEMHRMSRAVEEKAVQDFITSQGGGKHKFYTLSDTYTEVTN